MEALPPLTSLLFTNFSDRSDNTDTSFSLVIAAFWMASSFSFAVTTFFESEACRSSPFTSDTVFVTQASKGSFTVGQYRKMGNTVCAPHIYIYTPVSKR